MQTRPVALVTGGAKRVGSAIVSRLAAAGYDVAFTYLQSAPAADELVARIAGDGGRAIAISADLLDPSTAVDQIEHTLRATFDRLDVLVNNASIYEPSSLATVDLSMARRMMAMHFEAPLLLCQRFAGILRAARGHVVNMADLLAERPLPNYLAYCASKAALVNLTKSLARELAPDVTVNCIAPGAIQWPKDYPQDRREAYLRRVPLERVGTPEEAAELVLFLCSSATYMTGQVLRLDGGRSIT